MTLKKNTRRIAASGAVAAIAAIGFAGAAQAVSTSSCTATPYTPTYSYTNTSGVKVLQYKIQVTCSANRTATVEQYRMEEDTFSDDTIGHTTYNRSFSSAGTQYIYFYGTLPDTELGKRRCTRRSGSACPATASPRRGPAGRSRAFSPSSTESRRVPFARNNPGPAGVVSSCV